MEWREHNNGLDHSYMGRIVKRVFPVPSRLASAKAMRLKKIRWYIMYYLLSLNIKSQTPGTRLCQAVLGCTWLYQAVFGCTWLNLTVFGWTWLYLAVLGSSWLYQAVVGCTWLNLDELGCTWLNLAVLGCLEQFWTLKPKSGGWIGIGISPGRSISRSPSGDNKDDDIYMRIVLLWIGVFTPHQAV